MTVPVILLVFVNMVTQDVYYEQYPTMQKCITTMEKIKEDANEHGFTQYFQFCNEYDIELDAL